MSGVSPSRRLQLKTSDLTDLFRGSSSNTAAKSGGTSPVALSEEQQLQGVSPSKRRSSRIPFIGRSRKKSTHSEVVPFPVSPVEAQEGRPSAATSRSRSLLEEQHEVITPQPRASTSQPSLETPSSSAQPTFGSKIAAHFTPSKGLGLHLPSRKSIRRPAAKRSSGDITGYTSDTLSPPTSGLSPRTPSIDSTSSRGSRRDNRNNRSQSVTPRPDQSKFSQAEPQLLQPTITVSRPTADPYNLDEFDDLFTKPRPKQKPLPITITSQDRVPLAYQDSDTSSDRDRDRASRRLSSGSSNASQTLPPASVSDVPPEDVAPSTGSDSSTPTPKAASAAVTNPAAEVADSDYAPASVSSNRNLSSGKQSVFAAKQQYHRDKHVASEVELESAEESEAVSMKSSRSMPSSSRANVNTRMTLAEKRRTLAAMPYGSKPVDTSRKSSVLQTPSSKPPSIPLPPPPSPSSPSQSPKLPSDARPGGSRPRAHTISPSQTLPPSLSTTQTLTHLLPKIEPLNIDIDKASPDQLREALRQRNRQYNDLANSLSRTVEAFIAEKTAMENKLVHMEREAARRDKEIKGLTWLAMNNRSPGGVSLGSGAVVQMGSKAVNIVGEERSDDSSARSLAAPPSSMRIPLYRRLRAEDSGAESYPTSTTEWGSGTSGAEESMGEGDSQASRARRAMKKLKLVESANRASPITRALTRQTGGQTSSGEIPSVPRLSKRSSASSAISSSGTIVSSSSSTSTSSPSQSPTAVAFPTSPALSAIPEVRPTGTSARDKTVSISSGTEKEDRTRERRPSRISFHRSSPKPASLPAESSIPSIKASSRLTPSEAYARNLKKGRPASIAQVLDQTTTTDSAIEKSYGGRSRALLAGLSTPSSNSK